MIRRPDLVRGLVVRGLIELRERLSVHCDEPDIDRLLRRDNAIDHLTAMATEVMKLLGAEVKPAAQPRFDPVRREVAKRLPKSPRGERLVVARERERAGRVQG